MEQKTVVLGVTGSIAAYKAVEIASRLKKRGVSVYTVMTAAAKQFVGPITFESITQNPVADDLFSRETPWEVEHIALAKRADLFLVAPATANFLGKYAHGIADDMLTSTILATAAPVMIAPAMNAQMYRAAATQENIRILQERGCTFIAPGSGFLACGDNDVGRLAEPADIVEEVMAQLARGGKAQDFAGKRVLVTAGPTREPVDPVRYLSNRSSGKMGFAVAEAARDRGAQVVLVAGPTSLAPPRDVKVLRVTTTQEMKEAVSAEFDRCDVAVKAAAPADFTPAEVAENKIKKQGDGELVLHLRQTPDILAALGRQKTTQFLCGFAAETRAVETYAREKLERKNLDMIVANDVSAPGVGFDVDTNTVTMYTRDGQALCVSGSKREVADAILDRIAALTEKKS